MSRTFPRPMRGNGKSLASIPIIRRGFHQRSAVAPGASGREGETDSSLRQRNELMFLGNLSKAAGFPVLFRLLDPLLAGGNEIRPDMAWAFQRVAADEHHARPRDRFHRDALAGPEDQQSRPLVAFVGNFAFSVDEIDRAL